VNAITSSWVISEPYAGLQAQALGLAEAAGLSPQLRELQPRPLWRFLPAAAWPAPLAAVPEAIQPPLPAVVIGCGGVAAAVGVALRRLGPAVVQVQHPRIAPRRFDLVVVNRHDELTGPNVVVTRTALHRITAARLAAAAEDWRDAFAHLSRPLVAVLVGGSNGRLRLNRAVAAQLGGDLAQMMRRDGVGLVLTGSRRTDPGAARVLRGVLAPLDAWIWNGEGANPYFGMLALADAIVVTSDSVSMISEAVATTAPVMLAALPGRSRRNGLFIEPLLAERRVRRFTGRLETWPVAPLNDTPEAAAELRRRLRL
jgi:mitochondrial fission protein ELM1